MSGKEVPKNVLEGTCRTYSAALSETEIDNIIHWLDGHLDTFSHKFMAAWLPREISYYAGSGGGIGTCYYYRCRCGAIFDATDYGSW